jgi:predicted Zn finger-like uncharacterized protein
MLIACPSCATSYDVEVASLRPSGRQVRCVRCRTIWHAELSHADKLMVAAEAIAPVRRAVEAVEQAVAERPDSEASTVAVESVALPNELDEAVEVAAPPTVPADEDQDAPIDITPAHEPEDSAEPLEDIESVAARRYPGKAKRRRVNWPLSRLQTCIMALVVIDAVVVGWRVDIVRILPQTASFYARIGLPVNLRGLDFARITTITEQHENVPILVVQGDIVNDTAKIVDVPRLKFAVRNAARQEIYSWTAVPPRASLPPGETASFRSRLASPPPDAQDVLVRFVNRYDILAGAR